MQFGDRIPLIVDGGTTGRSVATTIVDLSVDGPWQILREGAIPTHRGCPNTPALSGCDAVDYQNGALPTTRRLLRWPLAAGLLCIVGWFLWVYRQIHFYATHDEARPADAIAVFGAAEYDGRPSPVLRARLDHALALYRERLAPLVITLGGGGNPLKLGRGAWAMIILFAARSRRTRLLPRRRARIRKSPRLGWLRLGARII